MLNGISISVSGVRAAELRLDQRANNVANLQTPGFNPSRADQVDLRGGGTRIEGTPRLVSQGPIDPASGGAFDMAVAGDGYFRVETSQGSRFTRNGAFQLDARGRIVDSQGNPLAGAPPIPDGISQFAIAPDGSLTGIDGGGNSVSLGQIRLTRFANPQGLQATGNSQYAASAASGAPLEGVPGMDGFGSIVGGGLELSSVDLATEMTGQIVDARSFEANLAVLKAQDDLLGEIIDLRR